MKDKFKVGAILGLVAVVVIVILFGSSIFHLATSMTVDVEVVRLERERNGGEDKYMIATDHEVFQNVDAWTFWKFNSSDLQAELREGKHYKLNVSGMRWHFFSWYRNVNSIEEVLPSPAPAKKVKSELEQKLAKIVDDEDVSNEDFRVMVKMILKGY